MKDGVKASRTTEKRGPHLSKVKALEYSCVMRFLIVFVHPFTQCVAVANPSTYGPIAAHLG
jgi:hypothetical protein